MVLGIRSIVTLDINRFRKLHTCLVRGGLNQTYPVFSVIYIIIKIMFSIDPQVISSNSSVPKYRQIVNLITQKVNNGDFEINNRIPSINEFSERCLVSRDTVEKAYRELKNQGVLKSRKSLGYYIANIEKKEVKRIFVLLNKFSDYKLEIYNSFLAEFDSNTVIDFDVYHCDDRLFIDKLKHSMGSYDRYLVMPHFKNGASNDDVSEEVLNELKLLPENSLLLVDNRIIHLERCVSAVYQDFKMDIYTALHKAIKLLKPYQKLNLLFPSQILYPYPQDIKAGFRKFCVENHFEFLVLDISRELPDIKQGNVYITLQESDLVGVVSQVKEHDFELGKDIGVISYNETALKKFLGISVFTTDFKAMGKLAADLVKGKKSGQLKNEFVFIDRGSL